MFYRFASYDVPVGRLLKFLRSSYTEIIGDLRMQSWIGKPAQNRGLGASFSKVLLKTKLIILSRIL